MPVLGIETATPVCSVALADSHGVRSEYGIDLGIHHSERLVAMMLRILEDAGCALSDLRGVAVSAGPGSFTGLRIGVNSAKGLCVSGGLHLVGVSSLAALAFQALDGLRPVCAMLDARRGQVYGGVYRMVAGEPRAEIEDTICDVDELVGQLTSPTVFVGSGGEVHRDRIEGALGPGALFPSAQLVRPRAGAVALVGRLRLLRGEMADPMDFEPVYLRPSQAEQVRTERVGREERARG